MQKIEKTVIKMSKDIEYIKEKLDKDVTKKIGDLCDLNGTQEIKITKLDERQKIQWKFLWFIIASLLGMAFWVIRMAI